jgi:hypothetical protein
MGASGEVLLSVGMIRSYMRKVLPRMPSIGHHNACTSVLARV